MGKATGESLIGATVILVEKPNTGATSNEYGFYSVSVPAGVYTLLVRYIGYENFTQKIDLLKGNFKQDIALLDGSLMTEVVVKVEKTNENIPKAQMDVEKLNMAEIKTPSILLSERDILKASWLGNL